MSRLVQSVTKRRDAFLPMSQEEAKRQGIRSFDIILVSGDAYVDHPLFCTAVIGRVLADQGYNIGIIAQPDWRSDKDFARLGQPRLFFGITSGNVDSMVNHYTARRMRRSEDVYSPGGRRMRPDRATIVYTQRIHGLFPQVPVVIGGIEASLRRFAHYDYWEDRVRQSILADAPADFLVFGMGERQVMTIAQRLDQGEHPSDMDTIAGTAVRLSLSDWRKRRGSMDWKEIPGFSEVSMDLETYARTFALHYREQDPCHGRSVIQVHPKTAILQNPPALPLSSTELDQIYELPYARQAHPSYDQPIPALEPVKFSVVSHRGCFGECSFCALTHHQGRIIQRRSEQSVIREVEGFTEREDFRGVVQDVGGPTANMYGAFCPRWEKEGACPDRSCSLSCPSLEIHLQRHLTLLSKIRAIPGVRKVIISSGIRHDLVLRDPEPYLTEVISHHISGHMKVAPEHIVDGVTARMHKPGKAVFEAFRERFQTSCVESGTRVFLLPYLMSGHPGCTIENMIALAEYLQKEGLYPEQVQDFTPTPMTASTTMYFTNRDPFTLEKVHVPRGREKRVQRALLHFRDPANYFLVREGLLKAGRSDLIGSGATCLIPAHPPRAARKVHSEKEV
jgi:uncharacterized radical SAM protein YgiQ